MASSEDGTPLDVIWAKQPTKRDLTPELLAIQKSEEQRLVSEGAYRNRKYDQNPVPIVNMPAEPIRKEYTAIIRPVGGCHPGGEEAIRKFESGAIRSSDVDHLRFDLIPHLALKRLAARYGMGAQKYGDHNYLKGIPFSNIINHMEAHINKFKADPSSASDDDLAAIGWAAFTLMVFQETRPELNDLIDFKKAVKE
jgi:hypothetical protein